jgi:hypothetical protein
VTKWFLSNSIKLVNCLKMLNKVFATQGIKSSFPESEWKAVRVVLNVSMYLL